MYKTSFLFISFFAAVLSAPQDIKRYGDGFRLSKDFNINGGKSSIGATGGWNSNQGVGLGLQGSHNFGQGTKVSASIFDSKHGGTEKSISGSHGFGQGTSVFGSHETRPNAQRNTFGAKHDFGQGTSISGSHSKTSFGNGFGVKNTNVGISHKTDYGTFGVSGGHNSRTGSSASIGGSWGFGRKRRSVPVYDEEEEEEEDEEFDI